MEFAKGSRGVEAGLLGVGLPQARRAVVGQAEDFADFMNISGRVSGMCRGDKSTVLRQECSVLTDLES